MEGFRRALQAPIVAAVTRPLTPKTGGGVPFGTGRLLALDGRQLRSADGQRLVGTSYNKALPLSRSVKDIAALRCIQFGSVLSVSDYNADASLRQALRDYCDIYVTSNSPSTNWTASGSWSWGNMDAFVAIADADQKSWRYHTVIYPAKEPAWINTTNITAANWKAEMESQFAALASRPYAQQMTSIDVINEVCRGDNAGDPANIYGLRKIKNDTVTAIPWYPAATANPFAMPGYPAMADPGATYVLYAFYLARQYFPNIPLYFCHDQTEQVQLTRWGGWPAFSRQLHTNILNLLTALKAAGAPIDGVNFQGHLVFTRSTPSAEFRSYLQSVKSLGLKFIIGELDVRSGQTDGNDPANYSTTEYNRVQAEMTKSYLDIAVPLIDGGEFLTWGVSDLYQAWETGEKPLPYDDNFVAKPMLTAIRNSLLGI